MADLRKRLRHPHHLKKLYVSSSLHVLRHEHTGKRVHRQHTSYPILALLLLVIGLVLGQTTLVSHASTGLISSVVSGPVPTVAATIDTPTQNQSFESTPISVEGSCPLDSYVQLFRNNYPSGTAYCTIGGTYEIKTDLFEGSNALIVRSYNLAGQSGPDSEIRTVTYSRPVMPVTPPVQGSAGTDTTAPITGGTQNGPSREPSPPLTPLTLRNDYLFQGFFVGDEANWRVALSGGTAPYSINVDWGDGSTALYTSTKPDTLTLTHIYKADGPDNGGYTILVTASDADGHQTTLQIVALVSDVNAPAVPGGGTKVVDGGGSSTFLGMTTGQILNVSWATVSTAGVALLGFWLGEVRELRLIRSGLRPLKH